MRRALMMRLYRQSFFTVRRYQIMENADKNDQA